MNDEDVRTESDPLIRSMCPCPSEAPVWERYAKDAADAFREMARTTAEMVSALTALGPHLDRLHKGYLDLSPLERKRLRGKVRYLRAYRHRLRRH